MRNNNLFNNIWDLHIIASIDENTDLLAIDRCYMHDLGGASMFETLQRNNHTPLMPSRIFGIPDHTLSSKPGRTIADSPVSQMVMPVFTKGCADYGIEEFGMGSPKQGIVHVVGPETGLTLPGSTVVCCDSHTCTHGALGALAWGIGTTELYHVLVTQTLMVSRPKTLRLSLNGRPAPDVTAMDIILGVISRLGADFAAGYAVEYAGGLIRELDMEQRMTLCNLSVEFGSEYGLISPDDKTLAYVKGREYAPRGEDFARFAAHCKEIASTEKSTFDKEVELDLTGLARQVSWGVSPAHTIGLSELVPEASGSEKDMQGYQEAYAYMDISAGAPIAGVKIDRVFIGSCSNGRISNIKQVAELAAGKRVHPAVEAWVVPGSQQVKKEAEALGYAQIIQDAGFVWGEPSCSLCSGSNGEKIPAGQRCVSTTNRNFIGRQGPGARTHLASPVTAVHSALNGHIS